MRDSFPRLLVEYLWRSGIHFNFVGDHLHFNMNYHYTTLRRLTTKTWQVCYFFHVYYFNSQTELIEWIDEQRRRAND